MNCTKCPQYSYPLRRCKLGKINPKTISGAVSAMRVMGISYICTLCDIRDKAIKKLTSNITPSSKG